MEIHLVNYMSRIIRDCVRYAARMPDTRSKPHMQILWTQALPRSKLFISNI